MCSEVVEITGGSALHKPEAILLRQVEKPEVIGFLIVGFKYAHN